MRKKKSQYRQVAEELSLAEMERILKKIGALIHSKRKARTTLESFAYEINVSRSAMSKYESGNDMYLSTFLKLLHGLGVTGEEFFKEVNK